MKHNLKPLVNNPTLYSDFLEEIKERLQAAHKKLEVTKEVEEIYRLQGEARALNKFTKLKEHVNGNAG